ncbi:MAG: hypothetical protein QXM68_04215 [Candidatus Aenigmatarchaeota archaeon]|nr:hypothetical protein [Candidatus Aenigmarchaeota archaeon]
MKKSKFDIKAVFSIISYIFIGVGIGLIVYPYLIEWLPFLAALLIFAGVIIKLLAKN